MPNNPIDPASIEGQDLIQWYRRPLWQVDQERRIEAAQRYNDFFGGLQNGQPDAGPTDEINGAPGSAFGPPGVGSGFGGGFPSTSLLPLSKAISQQPSTSPATSPSTPPSGTDRPQADLFSFLFPWAVPVPGGPSLKSAAVTAPGRPQVGPDPSQVDVFPQGPDGKLHPLPGWRTTGPLDFGAWAHAIDGHGVMEDVGHIADGVMSVEGVKAAGDAFLDALGPGVRRAVERGILGPGHGHHPIPKFMGGAADQGLADLAPSTHIEYHKALNSALRKTNSPPIGGRTGNTAIWLDQFESNPTLHNKALELLRHVTRNFDIERGTSITPHLERELRLMKPVSPRPRK